MAEIEGMKEIVNQAAIQAAMVAMLALRDAEEEAWLTTWKAIKSHKDMADQFW